MKHLSSAAVLAITLTAAAPAAAETLTEQGVTREQVIKIMTAHGLPARIDKDSSGNAYSKPGKVIWAEKDVIIGRTTTENIGEYLTMWSSTIARFKEFMNL